MLRKKGLRDALDAVANAHPNERVSLYFQDEMRVGQKGRLCHRWWIRGHRPPGLQDQRFEWAYIFGAARPDGENAFALVLPEANAKAIFSTPSRPHSAPASTL
jgi:hypothetical protein